MKSSVITAALAMAICVPAVAQSPEKPWQHDDGTIEFQDRTFASWSEFHRSDLFDPALKCMTPSPDRDAGPEPEGFLGISPSDCSLNSTSVSAAYEPTVAIYRIPCVVHVITDSSGNQGNLSDAQVLSGIRILNEDMNALLGTPGQNGTEARIEFYLAQEDPNGNPSDGITRSANSTWFNDGGNYWDTLAWDTNRYCNIYTNTAGGALGYVSGFPAESGHVGSAGDRVVVLWSTYGEDGPYGPPYNLGRTLTHEIGHYLGLYHTFQGGCGSSACYTSGDLICDTNSESGPNFDCSGGNPSTCGSTDPIDNYMDYSDDDCMEKFTPEQANRMRCSLLNWRPLLYSEGAGCITSCTGDLDNDGIVGSSDLGLLISGWGGCSKDPEFPCCSDLDGSGVVDSADLGLLIVSWGGCPVDPCEGVDCNDGDSCTTDTCIDGECFNEPIPGCGEGPCGNPSAGSCFEVNGSPGCDDATCCEPICAADPYCCDTDWDQLCVNAANANCGDGGGGGAGDCCSANGSPGCDDAKCQTLICNADPYCCQTEWDQICSDAANTDCAICNN